MERDTDEGSGGLEEVKRWKMRESEKRCEGKGGGDDGEKRWSCRIREGREEVKGKRKVLCV